MTVCTNDVQFHCLQGLFGIPELTSFEGFYALRERTKIECDNLVEDISCNPGR